GTIQRTRSPTTAQTPQRRLPPCEPEPTPHEAHRCAPRRRAAHAPEPQSPSQSLFSPPHPRGLVPANVVVELAFGTGQLVSKLRVLLADDVAVVSGGHL